MDHDRFRIVDSCHAALYNAGWSTGDCPAFLPAGEVWQVYALRDEHRILARAKRQSVAWMLALRQAWRLEKE